MTVVLNATTSGAQGLFNRVGRILYALNLVNEFAGKTGSIIATDLPTEVNDILTYFDGVTDNDIRGTIKDLLAALSNQQSAFTTIQNALRTAAKNTVIKMVQKDNPQPEEDIDTAIVELAAQMTTAVASIDANEPTAAIAGTTVGNGKLAASVIYGTGKTLENVLAEDIICKITSASANAGTFTCEGELKVSDKLSHLWPKGSGASTAITSVDASGSANKLTNGTFEAITANVPDNWTLAVGVAGTDILQETTTIYDGAKAVKYVGGATLTQIYQAITGLVSRTPYAVCFWGKVDVAPAAGVLTIDLHDGTNVINDDAGTANSFTVALTTIGTTFVAQTGVFRIKEPVPATVRLRVRVSTALSAGSNFFFDHMTLQTMTQLYSSGPYLAAFTGSTDWALDDKQTVTIANDQRGDFQTGFYRLFEQENFVMPSNAAGAETVPDTLVTT